MNLFKVLMGDEQRFYAVVFRDDSMVPGRLWVCLRGELAPADGSWSGCWSRDIRVPDSSLFHLLEMLQEKVARGGRSGPFGPYLDDTYFFDGWNSWGSGVPAPLVDVRPGEAVDSAVSVTSIDELVNYVLATG
jgi:hypothetical protein